MIIPLLQCNPGSTRWIGNQSTAHGSQAVLRDVTDPCYRVSRLRDHSINCNVKRPATRSLWRRIPAGLRYLRAHGLAATWRRVFPRPRGYPSWVESYDTLGPADIRAIADHIRCLPARPLLSVILAVVKGREPHFRDTVTSVTGQLYPHWELSIAAAPEALRSLAGELNRHGSRDSRIKLVPSDAPSELVATTNAAIAAATGEFVLFLDPRDKLAAHALYMIAVELDRSASADIIYSDEDEIDDGDRRNRPKFKSDWNPDLFLGCNLIGRLAAYRRSLVEQAGGFRSGFPGAEEYDLGLRASELTEPDRVRHIPMILYHRRVTHDENTQGSAEAVAEHLERSGTSGTPVQVSRCRVRIRYPLPGPPPGISLIVPTRDRLELLRKCVDGLLSKTNYGNVEIIIVDNDSELAETHAYFAELSTRETVRILKFSGEFNYSAINNFAVERASHDIIGFLNNDLEVIHPDWLAEMVSHIIRPEIGIVGAKLLYPDNTVQHAGTIVGLGGLAGHAFRHFARDDSGYLGRLQLTQNMSAVTAACMLIRKPVFQEVGGFDAYNLPIAYNDVDLCLRVREQGYRIVWTPFAELYHHESGSRTSDFAPERIKNYRAEMSYLKARWKDVIGHDPFYSPNLTIEAEDFTLAYPPRVVRPWDQRR